jgi:Uma2 family endonuclease
MGEGESAMSLSLHDVEKLQALYPNHQIELRGGKIILMNPLGILIDPDSHTVSISRSNGPTKHAGSGELVSQVTTLRDGDTLTIPELFPGWEIPVASLWSPAYE